MSRWLTPRSLLLHLAVMIWVPGCAVAAWWQVTVALAGNSLGWLYAVEWPVFAVLGAVGWWQLVHDDPATLRARRARRRSASPPDAAPSASGATAGSDGSGAAVPERIDGSALPPEAVAAIHRAEDDDEELAAYNAYLATLAATGRRKSWRDPTGEGDG